MNTDLINQQIKRLELREWTQGDYAKQNWGAWMHSISSYVGRIKPAFAHVLIDIFSNENDLILDPFAGVGTVPLEADNMGRRSIANDLNPYAHIITKAKFDRKGLDDELNYLKNLPTLKNNVDLSGVPSWVREFYHDDTLNEILNLRQLLLSDDRFFLFGCLLGIVHGHRSTHLSMRTG